jgi:hypothetical protein
MRRPVPGRDYRAGSGSSPGIDTEQSFLHRRAILDDEFAPHLPMLGRPPALHQARFLVISSGCPRSMPAAGKQSAIPEAEIAADMQAALRRLSSADSASGERSRSRPWGAGYAGLRPSLVRWWVGEGCPVLLLEDSGQVERHPTACPTRRGRASCSRAGARAAAWRRVSPGLTGSPARSRVSTHPRVRRGR